MPYISLPEELPGIRGLMAFRPETASPLNQLAEILLRDENTLTRGERELMATYISYLNDCFCNRYVDGLNTDAPTDRQYYIDRGPTRAAEGYAHFDLRK